MRKVYSEEQIIKVLDRLRSGVSAQDVCREMGVSRQSLYTWRRKFGGLGLSEMKRLRVLERENANLKRLVADLNLDNQILKDSLLKS